MQRLDGPMLLRLQDLRKEVSAALLLTDITFLLNGEIQAESSLLEKHCD